MKHKLTPFDFALWAALPMAHTSKIEGRLTMILDDTCHRTSPRRVLLLAAVTGAAVLVPLAMLKPAAKAQMPPSASVPGQQETATLHLSDVQKQLRLEQARQIREHLAPWAQANKAALLHMQQARPDDLAALMRVYDSLAKQPLPLWNGDPRIGRGGTDPGFSAQTAALTLTHLQRSQEPICRGIRQDFAAYQDFRVSRSVDPGNVCFVIWASGRITESAISGRFMGHGKPFLQVERQKNIESSFFPSADDKKINESLQYSIAE